MHCMDYCFFSCTKNERLLSVSQLSCVFLFGFRMSIFTPFALTHFVQTSARWRRHFLKPHNEKRCKVTALADIRRSYLLQINHTQFAMHEFRCHFATPDAAGCFMHRRVDAIFDGNRKNGFSLPWEW